MREIDVKVMKISHEAGQAVKEPAYATGGSAGMDLCACIAAPVKLAPGEIVRIPTGIAIQLPEKHVGGFVFPRSGLSSKYGISLINSVGVIDSDYTGEIICPMINHSDREYIINPGDRIAQIVFMPVYTARLIYCDTLEETERGSGGFGSTGI